MRLPASLAAAINHRPQQDRVRSCAAGRARARSPVCLLPLPRRARPYPAAAGAAGRAQSAPEQGPRSPGAPRTGQTRRGRQKRPNKSISRKWRPARRLRAECAPDATFGKLFLESGFCPKTGPGAARGPEGRRRRLGRPMPCVCSPPTRSSGCSLTDVSSMSMP